MAEKEDTLEGEGKPTTAEDSTTTEEEEDVSPEEEEEFEPPIRERPETGPPSGETPEGKRFWYELRKINERLSRIEKIADYGETEFEEGEKSSLHALSSEVDEKLSAFVNEIDKKERQREFKDFLRENPSFQKYGKKLEKFINHQAYQNIPIDFIARALAFDEAQKIGAEKSKEAEKEAERTKIGGSPFKPSEKTTPDYMGMSREEFEKEVEKIKSS